MKVKYSVFLPLTEERFKQLSKDLSGYFYISNINKSKGTVKVIWEIRNRRLWNKLNCFHFLNYYFAGKGTVIIPQLFPDEKHRLYIILPYASLNLKLTYKDIHKFVLNLIKQYMDALEWWKDLSVSMNKILKEVIKKIKVNKKIVLDNYAVINNRSKYTILEDHSKYFLDIDIDFFNEKQNRSVLITCTLRARLRYTILEKERLKLYKLKHDGSGKYLFGIHIDSHLSKADLPDDAFPTSLILSFRNVKEINKNKIMQLVNNRIKSMESFDIMNDFAFSIVKIADLSETSKEKICKYKFLYSKKNKTIYINKNITL